MLNSNGTIIATNGNDVESAISFSTRLINGLWSTSLVCTLTVALISMLVKQWLQSYSSSNTSNNPRTWARVRQHCISRIYRWRICCIITALPLLLHASLSLFLVGFAVLFWTADIIVGIVTALLISVIFVFYATTFFLPLIHPDCPFESPLLECIGTLQTYLYGLCRGGILAFQGRGEPRGPTGAHDLGEHHWHGKVNAEFVSDHGLMDMEEDVLDAKALVWLLEASTDSAVLREIFRTLPNLSYSKKSIETIRSDRTIRLVQQYFLDCFRHQKLEGEMQCSVINVDDAMIYCHAMIILSDESPQTWPIRIVECLWALQSSHIIGAKALASCALSRHALVHDLNAWDVLEHLYGVSSKDDAWLSPRILESLLKTVVEYVKEGALHSKHVIPALVPLLRMETGDTEYILGFALCRAFQLVAHDYESPFCPQCMTDTGDRICRTCFHLTICRCLIRIVDNPAQYGVVQSQGLLAGELAHLTMRIVSTEGVGATEHGALHECASRAAVTLASLLVNSRLLTSAGLSYTGFADIMALLAHFPSHIQLSHFSLPVRLAELLESPANMDETVLQNVLVVVDTTLRNVSFGVDRLRIFNLVGGVQVLVSLGLTVASPLIRRRVRDLVILTLRRLATAFAKASEQSRDMDRGDRYPFTASTGDFLANNFLDLTMDLLMGGSNSPLSPATFLDLSYVMRILCYRHPHEAQWRGLVLRIEEWLAESLECDSTSDALLEAWAHVMAMHELLGIDNIERSYPTSAWPA